MKSELNYDVFACHDLICEIKRTPTLLHLCGYVHIPQGHNYYGSQGYDLDMIEVHGGITLTEKDSTTGEWVIGFDCGHSSDFSPGMLALGSTRYPENPGAYKNWEFVKREVEKIAWYVSLAADEYEQKDYADSIDTRLAKKLLSL